MKDFKISVEVLKSDIKTLNKTFQSKDKEIINL